MTVRVLAFGAAAEAAGAREWSVELAPGARLRDLLEKVACERPALARMLPSLAFAVDQDFARPEAELRDGAEVALLPPASGGAEAWLTTEPIELAELVRRVAHEDAGGLVTFTGTVRRRTETAGRARETAFLHYEAYAVLARLEMERIAREAESRWPGARVAMCHRVGELRPGEASVAIAVSAPHRAGAFDACRFCIERLKADVPIWKKEVAPDGTGEWVNRP
ncbi:MAG: molybdenum cofactor biosynthesis protein MoaE [Clostridia bacterium]|nr:molybdenum cofactor biosynthesis protein MoaE [Clostridia bacterium]